MSTRGCVAVRREDGGWEGVYNHYDSYPEGLGKDVTEAVKLVPAPQLQNWCLELLKCDDWREFLNDGVCEYCGVKGKGQPHTIGLQSHKHTRDEGGPPRHITTENPDALFIEWVYVIDPFKREIEVLENKASGQSYIHVHHSTIKLDEDQEQEALAIL